VSDPILDGEERWLREALRAEEESLPVRLRPEDLGQRLGARRRKRIVRRLQLVAAVVVVAAVGLGAAWSIAQHGKPLAVSSAPISGPVSVTPSPGTGSPWVNGLVSVTPWPAIGPGLSSGRATLTLSRPKSPPSTFAVGCVWSVSGHVVGMTVGKQDIGGEYLFVRWSLTPGPKYQIELVQPDQTSFSGSAANFASQAAADGQSGSITFTNLVLNPGNAALTAPRRSGSFTWTCDQAPSLGSPAPSLPSPTVDNQGVPILWILQNGKPARRALTGCPIDIVTPTRSFATSCTTTNWFEPLQGSTLEVAPGDVLAFALDGWTVTSADVEAAQSSSPAGSFENPLMDLGAVLGNGAVAFSPPGSGTWYVQFTIEAAKDDGSSLGAEYAYLITVP
jgi:hypothetical protein